MIKNNIKYLIFCLLIIPFTFSFVSAVAQEHQISVWDNGVMTHPILVDEDISLQEDPNSFLVVAQENARIWISDIDTTDQFVGFRIVDIYFNRTTNSITYKFSDEFQNFLNSAQAGTYSTLTIDQYLAFTGGSLTDGGTRQLDPTAHTNQVDDLASAALGYLKTNATPQASGGTKISFMVSGDEICSETAIPGAYLIYPTSSSKVYAVMVANISLKAGADAEHDNETVWILEDGSVVSKSSDPNINKTIGNNEKDASYSVLDQVPFKIVGKVPQYPLNSVRKTYKITDTISSTLDFYTGAINDLTILDGSTSLTGAVSGSQKTFTTTIDSNTYTVAVATISGRTLTITFNPDYIQSDTVTINYKAELNSTAALGPAGAASNNNSAVLTYTNNPFVDATSSDVDTDPTTDGGEVTITTYGLKITVFKEGDEDTKLSGAKFEVYKDEGFTQPVILSGNTVATLETNTNGVASLRGLGANTYYLKQIGAPSGYVLNKTRVYVTPVNSTVIDEHGDPLLDSDGYVNKYIGLPSVGVLPFTGGTGTLFYTLTGSVTIVGAIIFIVYYKKKKNTNSEA